MIGEPTAAASILDPVRARVLTSLAEPGSSTTVAKALGESRQKINYHLRALEGHGLVRFVEERPRRGLKERVVEGPARSYVLSPAVIGVNAAHLERTDRLSSRYLIAVAARMVREVAALARGADQAQQTLATLAIEAENRFASATERADFTAELTQAVNRLVARYHDASADTGRSHRLVVAAHPTITEAGTTKD